jgi:HSP20 family molecular chaperone IbpA
MDYRIAKLGFGEEWDQLFREFDQMWNMVTPICKLPAALLSSHFPPCNYYADEDGTLHFEFAVAGYADDEVDLKFEDDHLVLSLNPKEEEKKDKWFQKGIKVSKGITKAFVPFNKFDVSKVEASLEKGMLKVSIPVKEEAKPVSVKIDVK